MQAPTTMQALTHGARAAGRSSWLVAPALVVAFLRSALGWPALLFALAMAEGGVASQVTTLPRSLGPGALVAGALQALAAPRTLAIAAALWLLGQLAAAALRVAWLSGALPTLGDALAHSPEPRARFSEGVAFGFLPLLPTALLTFVFERAADLCALAVYAAVYLMASRYGGGAFPVPAALVGAAALTGAVALPAVASLAADAALARTALVGDGPAEALWESLRRVAQRPGAFLLAGLAIGIATAALLGSAQTMETAVLGVARGAPVLLVLGPRLLASVLGAALGALVELWRLGTIAALACGEAES